ncbi:MAG: GH32 C-terminal domain-containing protein, partial [Lachnospiraceae bacterium]|nr:GH32 C-terminal domain-containing protein [Lachnospiraceae bacterium]
SDTISLEIFVNGGEEVFTTRIFDSMEGLQAEFLSDGCSGRMELYELIC